MAALSSDWSSLTNAPAPICSGDSPTLCEMDGILCASVDPRAQLRVSEVASKLPRADPIITPDPGRPASTASQQHQQNNDKSAKNAFLPSKNADGSALAKLWRMLNEEGFLAAIDQWTSNPNAYWITKVAGMAVTTLLNLSSFKPRQKQLSAEELMAKYSSTRDYVHAAVRCMSWHPHTAKLAIALKDDSIQIASTTGTSVNPLLKYKKQRGVSCMLWRPFSASELAVGCSGGLLVWTVDPASVVARPSAACVTMLDGHSPVTSLAWCPNGNLLLSASTCDTCLYVWKTASEAHVKLARIAGNGVHLVNWSPKGPAVMAATNSTIFRVWDTRNWTSERWNILGGWVNSACWSPCGSALFFTTSAETQVFCLRLSLTLEGSLESAGAAVPVMDLAKVAYTCQDGEELCAGGLVQAMRWDRTGERLVISFVESNLLAVFSTKVTPATVSISPLGYIRGQVDEAPSCFEFAKHFCDGALLSVLWSSGRLQYIPLFFISTTAQMLGEADRSVSSLLNSASPSAEFAPRIFSSPAF